MERYTPVKKPKFCFLINANLANLNFEINERLFFVIIQKF
jgi:hypothetical protein